MQNLAYKIEAFVDAPEPPGESTKANDGVEVCSACGEQLFGPDAKASSWQSWGTFWEILGMSNVELVCGACGEYLSDFFRDDKS